MTDHIRFRAILTGLFFGLLLCVFTPYNDAFLRNTPIGNGNLPLAPFFVTSWLFVIVALAGKISKKPPLLNGMELLTAWVLMILFTSVGWNGLAETFFVNVTAPQHFAKDAFRWTEVLRPLLPDAWYPDNAKAVRTLYNGLLGAKDMDVAQVLAHVSWGVWLQPLLVWSAFILCSFFVMVCLMRLFGKQWVMNERVMFPLFRVPQFMGEALDQERFGAFWADRFLLAGLILAGSLHLLNGLHFYMPAVPELPTIILAGKYFPKFGLFSGFHKLKLYVVPAFIGFAFLTTRQISFSFWFFFILAGLSHGLLYVLGLQLPEAALGVTFGADLYRPEGAQAIGAYGIFFIFLLWLARHHLKETILCLYKPMCRDRKIVEEAKPGTPEEWLPPSWPMWGLIFGVLFLATWSWWFGLPLLAALLLPCAFLVVALVSARVVCQGGLPYFTLTASPMDGMVGFFGTNMFGQAGIAMAAVMQKVLFLDMRSAVLPTLFHGSKACERNRTRGIVLFGVGAALILAVATAFVTMLYLGHKYGLRDLNLEWATRTVLANYENAQRLVDVPVGPNKWTIIYSGVGALVMGILIFCYYRLPWWPLHPLGYLVAYSTGMKMLWFSFFIGWLCNHLCLHYGGTALFNRLRFLFVGLILGDFLMGGFYALLSLWTKTVYNVFPI